MNEPDRLETRTSVAIAARYLGVSTRHVLHLIESRALDAWDVRRPGAKRATYSVAASSIRFLLETRYLPAREVLRFRDAAFTEHYTDASYLEMIRRRFGAKSIEDIRRMTAHRLERDLLTGALDVPPTLLPPDDSSAPAAELIQLARK